VIISYSRRCRWTAREGAPAVTRWDERAPTKAAAAAALAVCRRSPQRVEWSGSSRRPGHVAAGQQPLSAADTVYVLAKLLITRLGGSSKTTQVRRRLSSASLVARCFFATNERSRRRRQRGQAVESWSHGRPGVERTSGSRSSQLVPRSALKRLWFHYRDQWRNYVYVILRFRCA